MMKIRLDRRVSGALSVITGGAVASLGIDAVRVAISNGETVNLMINKVLEPLFDFSISIAKIDGGSTALMVGGGIVLGAIGGLSIYEGFKRLTK